MSLSAHSSAPLYRDAEAWMYMANLNNVSFMNQRKGKETLL